MHGRGAASRRYTGRTSILVLLSMVRRPSLLVIALLGIACALPAAAQWKWKDASGRVQYSDLPPPAGVTEKDILQRPNGATRVAPMPTTAAAAVPAASAASGLGPKGVEPELEAKRKKAEQEEAAKRKAEEQKVAAAKAENCSRARDAMRTLESGVRMARVNAKGEREVYDDKMRAEEMKRARQVAQDNCS